MLLDSSVIVAILLKQYGYESLLSRIDTANAPIYTTAIARFEMIQIIAHHQASTTQGRPRPSAKILTEVRKVVNAYLDVLKCKDITINEETGRLATEAAMTYGKAVGHAAALNFADCFSYACAKQNHLPLLYNDKGFGKTDLR